MLLVGEILFIALLMFLLLMIIKNERLMKKLRLSRAVVEECWDGKDRRRYSRFQKELDVIYALEKKSHLKKSGKTIDISEGGAKLLIDKKLAKGVIMNLKLDMPPTNKPAEIEGRVVWAEEVKNRQPDGKRLFHIGIEFSAVKEPHGTRLLNYLRSVSAG